ncbi:MAG: pantothenate kinase [Desulfobulbaceae bacterium]|nr:MAG: pantothenate kinase [Desulfobulbaceae bacterium]
MLLTIDIGNSHTVLGLYRQATLLHHYRVKTDRHATADELIITLHGLLALNQVKISQVTDMIVGSVVPALQSAWRRVGRHHIKGDTLVVGDAHLDCGVTVLTDNPPEVGADRIINTLAGFHKYQDALIIADFGTAITFDCVSAQGEYMGGAIAPGMAISLEALGSQTAKLPKVDISTAPQRAIATNTGEAIQSGMLYGYGGLIEGLTGRLRQEFPSPPMVIATGGMAALVAPFAPSISHIEPHLTLEGLRLIYDRNR